SQLEPRPTGIHELRSGGGGCSLWVSPRREMSKSDWFISTSREFTMKTFGAALFSLIAGLVALDASPSVAQDGPRASYYKNGEIHVTVLGSPETTPLTSGYWDFKPSWSQTGDRLVFFRRLK